MAAKTKDGQRGKLEVFASLHSDNWSWQIEAVRRNAWQRVDTHHDFKTSKGAQRNGEKAAAELGITLE